MIYIYIITQKIMILLSKTVACDQLNKNMVTYTSFMQGTSMHNSQLPYWDTEIQYYRTRS